MKLLQYIFGGLKPGDKVLFITRTTRKVPKGNSYTQEIVLRGVWDGKQAVLEEQFDPRKLKTIVKNKEWLIKY